MKGEDCNSELAKYVQDSGFNPQLYKQKKERKKERHVNTKAEIEFILL
jgi:hypothetical protein